MEDHARRDFSAELRLHGTFDSWLVSIEMRWCEILLPAALRHADADAQEHRQARLVVYASCIAFVTVLAVLVLLCSFGFQQTAMNAAWLLALQPLPLVLLRLTAMPAVAAHAFMIQLFGGIAWDFGPDNGYGVLVTVTLVVAGWALLGLRGGLVWTFIGVSWAGLIGPFFLRADDYEPALSLTTAVLTLTLGVAGGVNEVTRRRVLETSRTALRQLQQQRDSMRTFVEVAFSAWIETRGGELTKVSEAAADLLGVEPKSLIGRRLREFIHIDDLNSTIKLFLAAPEHGFRTELRVRHSDGHWLWLEALGVPLAARAAVARAANGDVKGNAGRSAEGASDGSADVRQRWIFGLRDIAEERRSRERLIRAQRLESVGQLAAGIAHDFNNLLTVINGFAELLNPSDGRDHILRAGRDAAKLTADIMAFARASPSVSTGVDVSAQIIKWRPLFESLLGERIRLQLDVPDDPLTAQISDAQLNQILLNLVSNARDALPAGGTVEIAVLTGEAARHRCEMRGVNASEHICLIVRDDGSGMSEAVAERAFDPFYTTKPPGRGTGLGLASVYGIVSQQGGIAELQSSPGEGTEVLIILRRQAATESEVEPTHALRREALQSRYVLLLEDNLMVSELIVRALRDAGFDVASCQSVQSARERMSASTFDLLITDVVLSGELGTDFAIEARQLQPDLPVLLISGYADVEFSSWRQSVEGRSTFLAKPFSMDSLLREVHNLLPVDTLQPPEGKASPGVVRDQLLH